MLFVFFADNQAAADEKMLRCKFQDLVVVEVGAWGAKEQEEARVKYHSCFMLTLRPVPPASGDLVIYGTTDVGAYQATSAPWPQSDLVKSNSCREVAVGI